MNSNGAVGPVRGSGLNLLGAAGGVPLLKVTRNSTFSSIGGKSSDAGKGSVRLSGSGLNAPGARGGGPAVISWRGLSRSRSRSASSLGLEFCGAERPGVDFAFGPRSVSNLPGLAGSAAGLEAHARLTATPGAADRSRPRKSGDFFP